ncbi:MAG: helix-turn-helix domain-containing protein [Thaumarchaeota archaeon]|jgi:DNA-directed RNA polymerase specialized sigma24 family protein|nr:helix-turn-helix domain-containing protein [Candidatus Geocrenenecus arthurdayi]
MALQLLDEAGLTTRQRQVYELIRVRGHSISEAAEALGISRSSTYYHLRRAVEKIEKLKAEREFSERLRRLESKVKELEWELAKHRFLEHILRDFLRD